MAISGGIWVAAGVRTGEDLVTRLPDGTNTRELIGENLNGAKIKDIAINGEHDGVIQLKRDGSIGDLVAFTPTQIKSAICNNGDYDPKNADICFSVREGQSKEESFAKWFGHSQVVNESGQPMVVYHVTNADFSVFDASKAKRAAFGAGFYFAADISSKKMQGTVEGSTVMPVYLSIKRPASLSDVRAAMDEIGYGNYTFGQEVERGKAITANLEKKGFDGADIDGDWLAFRPEQIKSAINNSGAFDPHNPDIFMSVPDTQRSEPNDTEDEPQRERMRG